MIHMPIQDQFKLLNYHVLSPDLISKYLDKYYLMHWNNIYACNREKFGIIEHQDSEYIVIGIDRIFKSNEISLSFRKTKEEFNLPNYVLIGNL